MSTVEILNVVGWGAAITTIISTAAYMEMQTRREIRELTRWVKREKQMAERGELGDLKTREEIYKLMDDLGVE